MKQIKVLVNGELAFTGSEKEVLKYAKALADTRYKLPEARDILKDIKRLKWDSSAPMDEEFTAKLEPLKIEFQPQ